MAVDTSGWQLIATFPDTVQASIAAGMLEDHGVPAIVGPDRMATIYMAGTTWAQIPLHVPAGHAAKARRLLEEHGDI